MGAGRVAARPAVGCIGGGGGGLVASVCYPPRCRCRPSSGCRSTGATSGHAPGGEAAAAAAAAAEAAAAGAAAAATGRRGRGSKARVAAAAWRGERIRWCVAAAVAENRRGQLEVVEFPVQARAEGGEKHSPECVCVPKIPAHESHKAGQGKSRRWQSMSHSLLA